MILHRLLNYIIKKAKNQDFKIDEAISERYIFSLIVSKILMFIKGIIFFSKPYIFIDCKTKILEKRKITFQGACNIGRSCYIDALSTDGIIFGKNVSIGKNTTIECTGSLKNIGKGLVVGDNVGLGTHGFFGCAGGIKIGDDTILGNFVSMHSENHNYDDTSLPIRLQGVNRKGINIGKGCWIGAKATILDGANIDDGCIIAAGSVVIAGSYESNSIYGGVPAKFIKKR